MIRPPAVVVDAGCRKRLMMFADEEGRSRAFSRRGR